MRPPSPSRHGLPGTASAASRSPTADNRLRNRSATPPFRPLPLQRTSAGPRPPRPPVRGIGGPPQDILTPPQNSGRRGSVLAGQRSGTRDCIACEGGGLWVGAEGRSQHCAGGGQESRMYETRGVGGGGLGPKRLCTQNGPTQCSRWHISLFPTVTLVVGAGGPGGGVTPPLLRWCTAILLRPWAGG